MQDLLTYGIEAAGAVVTAYVAIRVALARMDERLNAVRAEMSDLEHEQSKLEAKIDKMLEAQQQTLIQLTRLATIIDRPTQ